MTQQVSRYDNLITIVVVAAILAMFSMVSQLTGKYTAGKIFTDNKPAVRGYTRPQSAMSRSKSHSAGPPESMSRQAIEAEGAQQPIEGLSDEQNAMVIQRFEQAAALMHARQYDYAIMALNQVLEIVPNMPEAYVNMGFAYLALKQYDTAKSAFNKAIDLRPSQANAYYGLASAWDAEKDYEAALGAMRTYIHLSSPDAPFLAKARAAIWEWEGLLGRIPGVQKAPEGSEPQIKQRLSPHSRPANQGG